MKTLIFALASLAFPLVASAQDSLYRCGSEYTNTPLGRQCVLIAKGVVIATPATKSAGSEWIIWKKFIYKKHEGAGIPLDPPYQAVGAHLSLADCLGAIEKSHSIGGNLIGTNPHTYDYLHGIEMWACLPKGVRAGAQQ